MRVREKRADDDAPLARILTGHFGGVTVAAHGREFRPLALAGFIAEEDGVPLGALTFESRSDEIEVITLGSLVENRGAGTALLDAVTALARSEGVRRLCLVTTNDNIRAIRFYQKRGWNLCALYPDAVAAARRIKPQIPLVGDRGIAIRHEIEFELRLD